MYYYINDSRFLILDRNKTTDTIKFQNGYEIYKLLSFDGKMSYTKIVNDTIMIKGQYTNSLRLFSKMDLSIDPITLEDKLMIIEYYHPLKDGKWYFYLKNELVKVENWSKGLIID